MGDFVLFLFFIVFYVCNASEYTNPVIRKETTPDPGVLFWNDTFYVATTGIIGEGVFVIHESKDLVNWTEKGFIFPTKKNRPVWSVQDYWAPEIHHINGVFVAYFTARNKHGLLCIGVATSSSPLGPFTASSEPIAKDPANKMGYIDATVFFDPILNGLYLIWKYDGNADRLPTTIVAQKLKNVTALDDKEKSFALLTDTLKWEGGIVEAPWIYTHNNSIYLFYSGNGYGATNQNGVCLYSVGVAVSSSSLRGNFTKHGNPILSNFGEKSGTTGPGHCSVVSFKNETYIVYHAWMFGKVLGPYGRHVCVDKIEWIDNVPVVNKNDHPSDTPRQVPRFRDSLGLNSLMTR